jgi:hypothetical protein
MVPKRAPDQNLRGRRIGDRPYGWIFRKAIMEVVDSSGFFWSHSSKPYPTAGLFITFQYYYFFIAPKVGKMLKAFKLFYIICPIPESFHIFPTGYCGRMPRRPNLLPSFSNPVDLRKAIDRARLREKINPLIIC